MSAPSRGRHQRGAITVEMSVTGSVLGERDVATVAEAVQVAEEFARAHPGRHVSAYRADEADYDHDGLDEEERDAIEDAVDVGRRAGLLPVDEALGAVNLHRRALGMGPLDPTSAGWTREDVQLEAARIERLPNVAGHLMAKPPAPNARKKPPPRRGSPPGELEPPARFGVCRRCAVCLRLDVAEGCCTVCGRPLQPL